jgi:hypothetical protein
VIRGERATVTEGVGLNTGGRGTGVNMIATRRSGKVEAVPRFNARDGRTHARPHPRPLATRP